MKSERKLTILVPDRVHFIQKNPLLLPADFLAEIRIYEAAKRNKNKNITKKESL